MKYAVVGLASMIAEGKGIECLNYSLYEGLPIRGKLNEGLYEQHALMDMLVQQLPQATGSGLNLVFNVDVHSLAELFETADKHFKQGGEQVNVFAFHRSPNGGAVNAETEAVPEKFALSQSFETSTMQCGDFAVAVSLSAVKENQFRYADFEMIEEKKLSKVLDECDSLELASSNNSARLLSLLQQKIQKPEQSLALSSVAQNVSYKVPALELLALIKACLQCYHRYIAGVPLWDAPHEKLNWHRAFYIAEQSRSWFVEDAQQPRQLLLCADSGNFLISDEGIGLDRHSQYFAYACPHLFPIAADSQVEFSKRFSQLKTELQDCRSAIHIRRLAKNYYQRFLDAEDAIDIKAYRAVVLAEDYSTLLAEIDLLESSLIKLFESIEDSQAKHEIKTPKGSYFTLEPLGEEGKVAFVFPGLGSSYMGLGQKIFQLFPGVFKESYRFTSNVGEKLREQLLYPRVEQAMSFQQKRQRDLEIVSDLRDLGKTDTTYSSICAHVMTDVFKVAPDMAFGYSMGEANMMTALDVWQKPAELENRFKQSPIFKHKLHGEMDTVKRVWKLDAQTPSEQLWLTLTLKANREQVEATKHLHKLQHVYLTLNNTEDNVVIAGQPQECMRLVEALGCRAIPMGFVPAIHCEITAQEYEGIAELYSMPTHEGCKVKLYSSSCYLPVPVRQKAIAYSIAKCFCEPVDFPRLVEKVYSDGARIFLEAGAGRTCSTWIDKILGGKKHVIVPLNAKGTEDSLTFARVMAKLFCHRVDVDLHPLYENVIQADL